MPGSSKAIHPSGIEIEFFEDTHKYISIIDGKPVTYFSGTGFVGGFFQQFDPTGEITKRCALKEGVSVDEIKERWAAKGRESCRLGTRTHEICEDIELGREIRHTPENDVEKKRFDNASKMAKSFYNNIDILGVEKIVFSPEFRLAGTIDLFGRSRKNGQYLIIDHKTNAAIDKENKYKKFALDPISHLDDTNFIHYALQLNFYQYLLQHEHYVENNAQFRLFLNHVTEEKAELIELPQLQMEIRDMLLKYMCEKKDWRI